MKLRIEGAPAEYIQKRDELIKALAEQLRPLDGELSELLTKALPRKEKPLKFKVTQELFNRSHDAYENMMDKMIGEIVEVLENGTAKRHVKKSDDALPLNKAEADEETEQPGEERDPDETEDGEPIFDPKTGMTPTEKKEAKEKGELDDDDDGDEGDDVEKSLDEIPEHIGEQLYDALIKAGGHKYIRRVPYTDQKTGKRRYRYYYAESASAREAQEGEEIKLGSQTARVLSVDDAGNVVLSVDGERRELKPDQWHSVMTRYYGESYAKSAERRAKQTINAVLKHVPRELLTDLKGKTDEQRLAELKKRVPEVYDKLQKAFKRAGMSPFAAKRVLAQTLERRGWSPEARALVVGTVIQHSKLSTHELLRASESLAGMQGVEAKHVATVAELRIPEGKPENFPESLKETATKAEAAVKTIEKSLDEAETPKENAAVAAMAMASEAIQKLQMLAQAYPDIQDRVLDEAREILAKAQAQVPRKEPTKVGAETYAYVAGDGGKPQALKVTYKLMEAGDAIASHNAIGFAKRKDYPENVQERAYHRDKAEQAKVLRNAQNLNPQFVVNTNPDAVNGPPLLTGDSIVLGGNSRTMSIQLAYEQHPEKAQAYKDYLQKQAASVGFTADDVAAMEKPILVRVVEAKTDTKEDLQKLVRTMNESFTQGMDPRTMQVAMGRKLGEKDLQTLATDMDEDQTLTDFLGSRKADRFVSALYRAGVIDDRNSNQYMIKGTRTLNNDGKTLISRMLVGRIVGDADVLSATGTQMMDSVARSVPAMMQAKAHGEGYDVSEELRIAIDAFNTLQHKASQGTMLGSLDPKAKEHQVQRLFDNFDILPGIEEPHPVRDNPKAKKMLEVLVRKRGPVQMAKVFREYATRASQNPEGQGSMFGSVSPDTIFDEVMDGALGKREEKLAASLTADYDLIKGGPYMGPRGGMWEDPEHKIPWKGEKSTHKIKVHKKIGGGKEHQTHTIHVTHKDGKVHVSTHGHGEHGPTMPKESLRHFVNDLSGKVDLPKSGHPDIDAVIDGKAEFLGKGDDGMAFKSGDKVVKVSTTVPYQPENPWHRSPDEAKEMLKDQVRIGNTLADMGIPGIQKSKWVEHEDKGFQIKDYVDIPEKFTREQLDDIQDTLIAVHKAGYSISDEIQAGLVDGKPVMFDVGKARELPEGEDPNDIYSGVRSDMDRMRRLYEEHGQEFVRRDFSEGQRLIQIVDGKFEKLMDSNPKFAHNMLDKGVQKRVKELKATLKGEELDEAVRGLHLEIWYMLKDLGNHDLTIEGMPTGLDAEPTIHKSETYEPDLVKTQRAGVTPIGGITPGGKRVELVNGKRVYLDTTEQKTSKKKKTGQKKKPIKIKSSPKNVITRELQSISYYDNWTAADHAKAETLFRSSNDPSAETKALFHQMLRAKTHFENTGVDLFATDNWAGLAEDESYYYHGGSSKIDKVLDIGPFNGFLFFLHQTIGSGPSGSTKYAYRTKMRKSDIVEASDLFDDEGSEEKLKGVIGLVQATVPVDHDTAIDLLTERVTLLELIKDGIVDGDSIELATADWELQGVTALAARQLGYAGVEVSDEHGVSYMLDMLGNDNDLIAVGSDKSVLDPADAYTREALRYKRLAEQAQPRPENKDETKKSETETDPPTALSDHVAKENSKQDRKHKKLIAVLKQRGYTDTDFTKDGKFYGMSNNELIDFVDAIKD